MPKEKIEIKGEQSAVEKYLFYYREILNGMELDSIAPESLLEIAIVFGEMQSFIPDIATEQVIAAKAIEKIKNDESPFLKYDHANNRVYKVLIGEKRG